MQGEGALAGVTTHFVRFGGCDYLCSWCDSLYAVLPEHVREAERLEVPAIVQRLEALAGAPRWVTLSGGNPALLELGDLVEQLHYGGYSVAVETQGSRWRDWLERVDCLTVSPKPPSSGMVTDRHQAETHRFMDTATAAEKHVGGALKIVVFDDTDLEWARDFLEQWHGWPAFLSAGTARPTGEHEPLGETHRQLGERYRWLCEEVAVDPHLAHVRVLPQLHVLAWGHARAV